MKEKLRKKLISQKTKEILNSVNYGKKKKKLQSFQDYKLKTSKKTVKFFKGLERWSFA